MKERASPWIAVVCFCCMGLSVAMRIKNEHGTVRLGSCEPCESHFNAEMARRNKQHESRYPYRPVTSQLKRVPS